MAAPKPHDSTTPPRGEEATEPGPRHKNDKPQSDNQQHAQKHRSFKDVSTCASRPPLVFFSSWLHNWCATARKDTEDGQRNRNAQ